MSWEAYLKTFIGILIIVNPWGAIPVFLTLTERQTRKQQIRTIWVASLVTGLILLLSAIGGEFILRLFGIGIPSFRVGGGILILLMAISMFHAQRSPAKQTREEAAEAELKEDVAVVPLATPLLAGPGAISTVIIETHQAMGWRHTGILCVFACIVAAITYLCLRGASLIGGSLGQTGLNILTRIMGLILAAIAVEFIYDGITQLFPGLGR